ncbi:MAG: circadian clock protein KaiB [Proteobacteria bacterium]|nr:circadian clock protein KaiB [Pseudomonadota bacterium]
MMYRLRLYITGQSAYSSTAIKNLESLCANELRGIYKLEVVDILENPQLAEDEKIVATPTLVRLLPPPIRRLVGDLSDKTGVLLGLDLVPYKREKNEE